MPRASAVSRKKVAQPSSTQASAVALYDTLLLAKPSLGAQSFIPLSAKRPSRGEQPQTVLLRNDISEFTSEELAALAALRLGDAATSTSVRSAREPGPYRDRADSATHTMTQECADRPYSLHGVAHANGLDNYAQRGANAGGEYAGENCTQSVSEAQGDVGMRVTRQNSRTRSHSSSSSSSLSARDSIVKSTVDPSASAGSHVQRRCTTAATPATVDVLDVMHLVSPQTSSQDPVAVAESILGVHHLDLSQRGLKNTDVAELALNVTHLYLNHNAIDSLDGVQLLAHLQVLHVRDNQIPSLRALAQLSQLSYLDARSNVIATLHPREDLPAASLRYLDLRHNPCDPIVSLCSTTSSFSSSLLLMRRTSEQSTERRSSERRRLSAQMNDGEAVWRQFVEQLCQACPLLEYVDGEEVPVRRGHKQDDEVQSHEGAGSTTESNNREAAVSGRARRASLHDDEGLEDVLTRAAQAAMREINALQTARRRRVRSSAATSVANKAQGEQPQPKDAAHAKAGANIAQDTHEQQSDGHSDTNSSNDADDEDAEEDEDKMSDHVSAVTEAEPYTSQPSTRLQRALHEAQCVIEAVECQNPSDARHEGAAEGSASHYVRATRWPGDDSTVDSSSRHRGDRRDSSDRSSLNVACTSIEDGSHAARRSFCEARAESLVTPHEKRLWRQFEQRALTRRELVQRRAGHGVAEESNRESALQEASAASPSRRSSRSSEGAARTPRRRSSASSASAAAAASALSALLPSAEQEYEMAEARQMQSKLFRDISYANSLVYGRLQRTLQSHWADVERVLQTRHALAAERRARRETESAQPSVRYERAIAVLQAEEKQQQLHGDGTANGRVEHDDAKVR